MSDLRPCPKCGTILTWIAIPCPDKKPGCAVLHYGQAPCPTCASDAQAEKLAELLRLAAEKIQHAFPPNYTPGIVDQIHKALATYDAERNSK